MSQEACRGSTACLKVCDVESDQRAASCIYRVVVLDVIALHLIGGNAIQPAVLPTSVMQHTAPTHGITNICTTLVSTTTLVKASDTVVLVCSFSCVTATTFSKMACPALVLNERSAQKSQHGRPLMMSLSTTHESSFSEHLSNQCALRSMQRRTDTVRASVMPIPSCLD